MGVVLDALEHGNDRRGGRRGDPPPRAADGPFRAAPDGRPARRQPRARDAARPPIPTAFPSRRPWPTTPRARTRSLVREHEPRSLDEILESALEAVADEIWHLLAGGRRCGGEGRRHRAPARRGLALLARRDHEVPRPGRHFGEDVRASALGSRSGSAHDMSDNWRIRDRAPRGGPRRAALLDRLGLDLGSDEAKRLAKELEGHRLAVSRDDDDDLRLRRVAGPGRAGPRHRRGRARGRGHRGRRSRSSAGSPRRSAGRATRRRRPGSRKRSRTATRPGRCGSSSTSHAEADRARRHSSSGEGYDVVRRWRLPDRRRRPPRSRRDELARRVHGEAEPGGEVVWEVAPQNPFALFGGLGG